MFRVDRFQAVERLPAVRHSRASKDDGLQTQMSSTSNQDSESNEAYVLVERAYALMEEKLEQDEIVQSDIEECQDALVEALEHPDADIWVTLVTEGPKNQLEHQRYPDGDYQWEPYKTNREALEDITEYEVRMTVENA